MSSRRLFVDNDPFPGPAELLIIPDHYIFRMLYSRGVSMESLGIPTIDGTAVEADPRVIWQRFADHYGLFRGTPTGAWFDHELYELFEVRVRLTSESASYVYDQIAERLASPEFRPRALFERFRIEVLATTDRASDRLEAHQALRESGWPGRVIPTFRPDAVFRIAAPAWRAELNALAQVAGRPIIDFSSYLQSLEDQRRRIQGARRHCDRPRRPRAVHYPALQ